MIALALLIQAAAVPPAPPPEAPATLAPQQLPARGCAAYLWSVSERRLIAVAGADPGSLRMALGPRAVDLPRTGAVGEGAYGLGGTTRYVGSDASVSLDLTVTPRPELTAGAAVPQGALTIERTGRDAVIVPVAGLVGCAADANSAVP